MRVVITLVAGSTISKMHTECVYDYECVSLSVVIAIEHTFGTIIDELSQHPKIV